MPLWFLLLYQENDHPSLNVAAQKGDLVTLFVSFYGIFVCEFRYRHASQRFYPRVPLFWGIFNI